MKEEAWSEFVRSSQLTGSYIYNTMGCYKVDARKSTEFKYHKTPCKIHRMAIAESQHCYLSPQGEVYFLIPETDRQIQIRDLPKITDIACTLDTIYLVSENAIFTLNSGKLEFSRELTFPNDVGTINLKRIVHVAPQKGHTLFLNRDGILFGLRDNTKDQLDSSALEVVQFPIEIKGDGTLPKFKKIAVSESHSLALSVNGDVYACGSNNFGQLGTGDLIDQSHFIKVENLPKIKEIAAIDGISAFIDDKDQLFICGGNSFSSTSIPELKVTLPGYVTQISLRRPHRDTLAVCFLGERDNTLCFFEWHPDTEVYDTKVPFTPPSERMDIDKKIESVFATDKDWLHFQDIQIFIRRLLKEKQVEDKLPLLDKISSLIKYKLHHSNLFTDSEAATRLVRLTEKIIHSFPEYDKYFEEPLSKLKEKLTTKTLRF
ncbi:MAG: RCC1 domain-containing protein [Gammaproteobacteria bacterium]